ncbi:MAG: hypothetical protein ACE5GO_12015, partial [Anaerolineales bacterium]
MSVERSFYDQRFTLNCFGVGNWDFRLCPGFQDFDFGAKLAERAFWVWSAGMGLPFSLPSLLLECSTDHPLVAVGVWHIMPRTLFTGT